MFKEKTIFVLLAVMMVTDLSFAENYLLYLEAQGVLGYSDKKRETIFYSISPEEVMQKPSIGFDYLQRFSRVSGDYGALAVQTRLAYNAEGDKKIEFQFYNAYLKYKAGFADIWFGHNRPALGLSSYLDSHAQLLSTLAMQGFGFDRDWGLGIYREFNWGNFTFTATTGSGMPLYFKGNYLTASRISKGILNQDNYSLGFSLAYGEILETMGYHLMNSEPMQFIMGGGDASYLWKNLDNRLELFVGKKMEENAFALFGRSEINFLEEGRLKLGVQPTYWKIGDTWNYQISVGISFQISGDLTIRSLYQYEHNSAEKRIVSQVYYYKRL